MVGSLQHQTEIPVSMSGLVSDKKGVGSHNIIEIATHPAGQIGIRGGASRNSNKKKSVAVGFGGVDFVRLPSTKETDPLILRDP